MKKITMLNITLYMVRGPPSSKDISVTFFQLRFCWTKGKELRACCANTLTPNVQLILVTTYACASAKLAASMCRSQTRRSNNIAGAVPIGSTQAASKSMHRHRVAWQQNKRL